MQLLFASVGALLFFNARETVWMVYNLDLPSVNCHLVGPFCRRNEFGCTTGFESECVAASEVLGNLAHQAYFTAYWWLGIWQRHYHLLAKMTLANKEMLYMA
ncbi:hypothetical protein POM88_030447 [Heracleum sosnowskyi]|uniref:Secreted protein n=1 Tax=Heracleum sosnowskyi TaxID=360622 RepID=A0AAD8MIR9_9APIA|nr:hypothetical protein POM88_030447 [Heracleum sosnowskyi]